MQTALGWLETLSTVLIFIIGQFLLAVAVMFVVDVTQTKHTVRRNFPVIGRFRYLFEHLKSPLFQCRFRWEAHSVAFWDNRCTQHFAVWDYYPHVRSGYRVTVKGGVPV